jgi:hypothetical protein
LDIRVSTPAGTPKFLAGILQIEWRNRWANHTTGNEKDCRRSSRRELADAIAAALPNSDLRTVRPV